MSELSVRQYLHNDGSGLTWGYDKREADKVISEKDAEIAELKAQKSQAEDDCAYWKMNHGNAANAMHETEEYAMQLYKETQHHKYKRCLAMAKWCYAKWDDTATKYYKSVWYRKWEVKWLELAQKFKEEK